MNVTDPIADMLTRLRNATMAGLASTQMPHSKVKAEIARILKKEGFITDYATEMEENHKILRVYLKYGQGRMPVLQGLRRISKPGLRRYVASAKIPRVGGMGIAILSTSQGIVTDKDARKSKVGGELLCYVW